MPSESETGGAQPGGGSGDVGWGKPGSQKWERGLRRSGLLPWRPRFCILAARGLHFGEQSPVALPVPGDLEKRFLCYCLEKCS